MTEDEAKTKWCPQARVLDFGTEKPVVGHNRVEVAYDDWWAPPSTNCLGSDCMAWRSTSSQHGYCGLAGRPKV